MPLRRGRTIGHGVQHRPCLPGTAPRKARTRWRLLIGRRRPDHRPGREAVCTGGELVYEVTADGGRCKQGREAQARRKPNQSRRERSGEAVVW
jgi:hypothetical protein